MENRNVLLMALAVIVVVVVASVYVVQSDDREPQPAMQAKDVLEPGDYVTIEYDFGQYKAEQTLVVLEAVGDIYRTLVMNPEGAAITEVAIGDFVGDIVIGGSAYTDVKADGSVTVQTFMGKKECTVYDVTYQGSPGKVTADSETGVVYEADLTVDGTSFHSEFLGSSLFDIFGPGEEYRLSDDVKAIGDVVPGDFYYVTDKTVYDDGSVSEDMNPMRVTVVSVDVAKDQVTCIKKVGDHAEYLTVDYEEFVSGLVFDPAGDGLVAGEEVLTDTAFGYRECIEYTHPDGIQTFYLGKDTNICYKIVFESFGSVTQYLDSTSMFGGVDVEAPVLGDTLKTADQVEVGDYIAFIHYEYADDFVSGTSVRYDVVSIDRSAGTLEYADDLGDVHVMSVEDFLGLLKKAPLEGDYDTKEQRIVSLTLGDRLCDVYTVGGETYMAIGVDSGISYISSQVSGGKVVNSMTVEETSLFV